MILGERGLSSVMVVFLGMLLGGLSTCAIVDESWVDERACWPLATLSRPSASTSVIDDTPVSLPLDNDDATSLGVSGLLFSGTKIPRKELFICYSTHYLP